MAALSPGTRFPTLALEDEKGSPAAAPGGETLYAFFKTTCPTCSFSWPYLDRLRSNAQGGALQVLAVSQDDPRTTAAFQRDLATAIATVYDPKPWKGSQALELTNVPTFFRVGSDGVIRDTVVGFQREKMNEFAADAARLGGRSAEPLFRPGENVPELKPG